MAIENNIIKSPIHLAANVARLLQTNKMTDAALCTHPNINKWAKNKPVRNPAVDTGRVHRDGTYDDMGISFGKDVTKDSAGMIYGLRVCIKTGSISLKSAIDSFLSDSAEYEGKDWVYVRPNGGQDAPFRLGDFVGYQHGYSDWAIRMGVREYDYRLDGKEVEINRIAETDKTKLTVFIDFAYRENSNFISSDCLNYNLCYFLTKKNDNKYEPSLVICENTIKQGGTTIQVPIDKDTLKEGQYRLYYGICGSNGGVILIQPFNGNVDRMYLNFNLSDHSVWTLNVLAVRTFDGAWHEPTENVPYGGNNIWLKIVARSNGQESGSSIKLNTGLGLSYNSFAYGMSADGQYVRGESSGAIRFYDSNMQPINTPTALEYEEEYIVGCSGAIPSINGLTMMNVNVSITLHIGFETTSEMSSISSSVQFHYA